MLFLLEYETQVSEDDEKLDVYDEVVLLMHLCDETDEELDVLDVLDAIELPLIDELDEHLVMNMLVDDEVDDELILVCHEQLQHATDVTDILVCQIEFDDTDEIELIRLMLVIVVEYIEVLDEDDDIE